MQQPYRPIPKIGPSKEEVEAERLAVDAVRRHRAAEGFAERVARACTTAVVVLGAIYVLSAFASQNPRGGTIRPAARAGPDAAFGDHALDRLSVAVSERIR